MVWKEKEINKVKEEELIKLGKHRIISRVLSQTGLDVEEIDLSLSTDYKDINNPFLLNDVEKAAKIFIKHAKNKSRVAIIGDYDCDGIVSSTMLYELCRNFNLKCTCFLPSRLDHGYGLNEKTIEAFRKKLKTPPDLLFVTDCGTSNRDEIDQLKEFGIKDIIVIDHHLPAAEEKISRNASALISWHLSEDFNEMCACGEVYQFIRGIRAFTKHVDPIEYLSYAAIGTIADSQPIFGDNRLIVKNGLTKYSLDHVTASGLNSLIKAKMKYSDVITQTDIEYRIAPIINASGRIKTPDMAFRLLTEYDHVIADEMANELIKINNNRREKQKEIEEDALSKAKSIDSKYGSFVYSKEYHIGIVGIVASRVVEETGKPALVIGYHNGSWKGSGRSINGVNLKEILDSCSFMFEKHGGHGAAVGATVKEDYLDKAQGIFEEACENYLKNNSDIKENFSFFNACLNIGAVNEKNANLLNQGLEPYCKINNPEPIFKLKNVTINSFNIKEGKDWRIANFLINKDDNFLEYKFNWFFPNFDSSIVGEKVNIYFTFPRYWDNSKRFQEFSLSVVSVEVSQN
jgi:single-stranded-DNA-specific exonuclease